MEQATYPLPCIIREDEQGEPLVLGRCVPAQQTRRLEPRHPSEAGCMRQSRLIDRSAGPHLPTGLFRHVDHEEQLPGFACLQPLRQKTLSQLSGAEELSSCRDHPRRRRRDRGWRCSRVPNAFRHSRTSAAKGMEPRGSRRLRPHRGATCRNPPDAGSPAWPSRGLVQRSGSPHR